MHGAAFGGSLGPAFLMLIPFTLGLRRPPRALLLAAYFCIAYLLLWASPLSSLQLRFVIPVLPALAILAAVGIQRACSTASRVNRRLPVVIAGIVLATLVLSSTFPEHARTRPPRVGRLAN